MNATWYGVLAVGMLILGAGAVLVLRTPADLARHRLDAAQLRDRPADAEADAALVRHLGSLVPADGDHSALGPASQPVAVVLAGELVIGAHSPGIYPQLQAVVSGAPPIEHYAAAYRTLGAEAAAQHLEAIATGTRTDSAAWPAALADARMARSRWVTENAAAIAAGR